MSIADLFFKCIDIFHYKTSNPKYLLDLSKDIERKEISYGNNKDCKFDIYSKSNNIEPLIFYIHGGGFVKGDKNYRVGLSNYYVYNNHVKLINCNYVMSPKENILGSVRCLVEALNYIYDHQDNLNIDINNIIITGDSSGAYFAAYLSELSNNQYLQDILNVKCKFKIKASILNCGIYSLEVIKEVGFLGLEKILIKEVLQGLDKSIYKDILNITDIVNNNFPYSFIIASNYDRICKNQHLALFNKLDNLNIKYTKYVSTNKKDGHVFQLTWQNKSSKLVNIEINKFIEEVIKMKD